MPVEIVGHLVCVVGMWRLVMALGVCLWACGDNQLPSADAMLVAPPFQPAPHVPMPLAIPHAGTVLSNLHLVTITYQGYAAVDQVEAFGDAIVGSSWYTSVGAEYGIRAGSHAQKFRLGPAPASVTRAQIAAQIQQLIADGSVLPPAATGNQFLYMIYIPSNVMRDQGLTGVRGYHDVLTLDAMAVPRLAGVQVPIAVVFDDNHGLAATTATAAHQLIDAVTDPYHRPMDGYYADPPMTDPWSLIRGEVADLCNGEPPVVQDGFTLPRVYSNHAAEARKSPCTPFVPDDTWSDVSAVPSTMQVVPRGGSVTFKLTGWSTSEVPDWKLSTQVSDRSELTLDQMRPTFSSNMINNGVSVTLTLHVPANATTGTAGGVYVLSGENVRPWAVGILVESGE